MEFNKILLSHLVSKQALKRIIQKQKSDGIIIQLPLPKSLTPHRQEILNCIPANKDIDALSDNAKVISPVVKSVQYILKDISLKGKSIALFGAGKLVGVPMALWLLRENATITTIHKYTKNPEYYTKKADIIISGVGKPNIIKANMVKQGVILVDVGFSVVHNFVVGDIDKQAYNKASKVCPVPGWIGKLSLVCLLENLQCLNQL